MTDNDQVQNSGPLKPLFGYSTLAFMQRASWLLLFPLYLNFMGPDEVAVLFLVNLAANFARALATLKLDAAMHTFFFDYDGEREQRKYLSQVFTASLLLAAVFLLVMMLVGPYLLDMIFKHDALTYYPYGAIAVATACANLCLSPYFSYLKNRLRFREFATYQVAMLTGTVALQVYFVAGLRMGVSGALTGALLPALLALAFMILRQPDVVTSRLDFRVLQRSLAYSLPLVVFAFLYMLGARLDRFVVERHFDLSDVGMYVTLVALFGLMDILQDALDNAIRPFLFVRLGTNPTEASSATRIYARLYVAVCIFGLSMIVFAGANISWITGNNEFLSLREYLAIGATAMVPAIYSRYCALFFVFYKKSGILTVWMAVRTVLTLVFLLWFVPRFGVEGALLAICISHALNAVMFRLHLTTLSPVAIPVLAPVGYAMLFLGVLWLSRQIVLEFSHVIFGTVQLFIVSVTLVLMNRRMIGELGGVQPKLNTEPAQGLGD